MSEAPIIGTAGNYKYYVTTNNFSGPSAVDIGTVAAIVEEANHLIYSVGKARISTLLEALLGKSSIGNDPAGKLLTYTLEEMQRLVIEAAKRHVPGLTAEMLDEATAQRKRLLVAEDRKALERRMAGLAKELEWAKEELRVLDDWMTTPNAADSASRPATPLAP